MLQINHRNFLNSSTCALKTQLCPQVTSGSREFLNCRKYSTHTYDYNRLNYGKGMHIRACCYVSCNCQSKLSVHTHLNEYVKALSWKLPYLIIPVPVPLLAWPTSPLWCYFCSLLNKLVFATDKASDSSLWPYQEPRPAREGPL